MEVGWTLRVACNRRSERLFSLGLTSDGLNIPFFTNLLLFNEFGDEQVVRRVMVVPLVSEILTVQPYSHPDLETTTVYDELGTSRVACGMEVCSFQSSRLPIT